MVNLTARSSLSSLNSESCPIAHPCIAIRRLVETDRISGWLGPLMTYNHGNTTGHPNIPTTTTCMYSVCSSQLAFSRHFRQPRHTLWTCQPRIVALDTLDTVDFPLFMSTHGWTALLSIHMTRHLFTPHWISPHAYKCRNPPCADSKKWYTYRGKSWMTKWNHCETVGATEMLYLGLSRFANTPTTPPTPIHIPSPAV